MNTDFYLTVLVSITIILIHIKKAGMGVLNYLQMTFGTNTSPFCGKEGKLVTATKIEERLEMIENIFPLLK